MQKLTNLESRINMTRYPVPGTRHPVPATRYPLPGTRFPVPATRTRVFHHALIHVLVSGDKAPSNIACWSFNVINIARILIIVIKWIYNVYFGKFQFINW